MRTSVSVVEASTRPSSTRADRWSCRSLPFDGSESAAWAKRSWRAAKRLGLACASALAARKNVTWKPMGPRFVSRCPVTYHHSMRNSGWEPASRGKVIARPGTTGGNVAAPASRAMAVKAMARRILGIVLDRAHRFVAHRECCARARPGGAEPHDGGDEDRERRERPVDFEIPVERLAIHDAHQHEAHRDARCETDRSAQAAGRDALDREELQDLAAFQSQETQHAELAPPRPRQRREAAGDSREPDHHRDRLEGVGHGEGAVEDLEGYALQARRILEGERRRVRQGTPDRGLRLQGV